MVTRLRNSHFGSDWLFDRAKSVRHRWLSLCKSLFYSMRAFKWAHDEVCTTKLTFDPTGGGHQSEAREDQNSTGGAETLWGHLLHLGAPSDLHLARPKKKFFYTLVNSPLEVFMQSFSENCSETFLKILGPGHPRSGHQVRSSDTTSENFPITSRPQ